MSKRTSVTITVPVAYTPFNFMVGGGEPRYTSPEYREVMDWLDERKRQGQHIIHAETLGNFYTHLQMRIQCSFGDRDTALLFKLTFAGE